MRTDQRIVKGVGLSRLWQLVLVHLLIGTTCVQVASAQEPSNDYGAAGITWQVVNRFPVFKDSERFARLAGVPDAQGKPRTGLWEPGASATSVMTNPQFYKGLREYLPAASETAWQESEQLYDSTVLFRKTNHIVASSSITEGDCRWELFSKIEVAPGKWELGEQVDQASGSCASSPYLKVPDISKPYRLRQLRPDSATSIEVDVLIKQKLVVALGDSFASGEGNPDYPAKFEESSDGTAKVLLHDWYLRYPNTAVLKKENSAKWWDLACHRSLLSWPSMAALKQAVNEPQSVIQFASFACSGAEIYDGLLRPQAEPPGFEYMSSPKFVWEGGGKPSVQLQYSQMHALALLLCDSKVNRPVVEYLGQSNGIRPRQRPFFGKFQAARCEGAPRPVDKLFFMFGGNDTGFSRVVMFGLYPPSLDYKVPGYKYLVNSGLFDQLDPIDPNRAYNFGILKLPELLLHAHKEFMALNIEPANTTLVGYPNLVGDVVESTPEVRDRCNKRTADGFVPMQVLAGAQVKNANARFGLRTEKNLKRIEREYIEKLRSTLRDSVLLEGKMTWRYVDSNEVFFNHGICAGSSSCKGDECPHADRVRWAWSFLDAQLKPWNEQTCMDRREEKVPGKNIPKSQIVYSCLAPPWRQPSEFELYDPARSAGVRYGTDILLGAARVDSARKKQIRSPFTKTGERFALDGLFGAVHPTAHMHALIADKVLP